MNSPPPKDQLTYRIIGLLYQVQNQLGHLHQEKHYQRAIAKILEREKLAFEQEKPVDIAFDNHKIGHYRLDFIINNQLILETKTTNINIVKYHHQVLSYMNQLQIRIGLLANFRKPKLQIKRLILPDRYFKNLSA
jgi:GxxExxY protein